MFQNRLKLMTFQILAKNEDFSKFEKSSILANFEKNI
jgi:hypothetical protein